MPRLPTAVVISMLFVVSGCGNRSSVSIIPVDGVDHIPSSTSPSFSQLDKVIVTAGDITDRPYRSLGDVSVVLSKWTMFSSDPTRGQIEAKLREKAAEIGADAVILVRYGAVGITPWTYGQLNGVGRAVQFISK